jgi:uncharacterized protein with GYD domain
MPKYMLLASYTTEGLKGLLKDGGSKRKKDLADAVKQLGGSLESIYFAFGKHDVYSIVNTDVPAPKFDNLLNSNRNSGIYA